MAPKFSISNLTIVIIAVIAVLFLISPVSAVWSIDSPDYSGTVDFYADNTGIIHLTGPVKWDLNFDYIQVQGPGARNSPGISGTQYQASTKILGIRYQVEFVHSGDMITSQAHPYTRLIWVP